MAQAGALQVGARLVDLSFPGQEHEDVAAGIDAAQLRHRLADTPVQVTRIGRAVAVLVQRPVEHVHGMAASRHLDHRRAPEMAGEFLRVDGRRGDDEPEIRAFRQQALEVAEEEIDVEAALVRLVDEDRVVGVEPAIPDGLGQQDAVGHELDEGVGATVFAKTDLETDFFAQRPPELFCHARRHGPGGDAPGLGAADQA
ncbi:MAG: hypothetical protein P8008_07745, partial [Gammaproteobacteria bacterium]